MESDLDGSGCLGAPSNQEENDLYFILMIDYISARTLHNAGGDLHNNDRRHCLKLLIINGLVGFYQSKS